MGFVFTLDTFSRPIHFKLVHDQTFIKFGHQMACRVIKNLKNSNDIDMTFNDFEMTFKYVFLSYLTFGQSYCHLTIQQ